MVGSYPSVYFEVFGHRDIALLGLILLSIITLTVCFSSWDKASWVNGKKLSGIRKLRLLFLGISLGSFTFALLDVIRFSIGNGTILVGYSAFPFVSLGGIPFVSVLISFAIGGLFTVMERSFEILENKDLK